MMNKLLSTQRKRLSCIIRDRYLLVLHDFLLRLSLFVLIVSRLSLQSYHIILEKDRNLETVILTTTSINLQKAKAEFLSKELIGCTSKPASEGGSKDEDIAE